MIQDDLDTTPTYQHPPQEKPPSTKQHHLDNLQTTKDYQVSLRPPLPEARCILTTPNSLHLSGQIGRNKDVLKR